MELSVAFGLGAVAVVVPGVTIASVVRRSAPPRVEPDRADTTGEPPAVVDLLTGGFRVEDDALPATIVDLAARGVVEVSAVEVSAGEGSAGEGSAGDGPAIRLRVVDGFDDGSLLRFEQRVVERIRTCGGGDDGWVTTEAFTGRSGVVARRWWRGFVVDVVAHARRLGLTRRRYGMRRVASVWGSVAVGVAAAGLITARWGGWSGGSDLDGAVGFVGMMSWAVVVGLAVVAVGLTRSTAESPTELGLVAAARWLGVRSLAAAGVGSTRPSATVPTAELARATALGLAPGVVAELPLETDHDRHTWSDATGSWRRVQVRFLSTRPHWGHSPRWAILSGGLQAIAFGSLHVAAMLVADDHLDLVGSDAFGEVAGDLRGIRLVALLIAGIVAPAALFGLASSIVGVVDGVVDLSSPRHVEGVVIARRRLTTGHRMPAALRWLLWSGRDLRTTSRRVRYHVAVDDGRSRRVIAHQVSAATFDAIRPGARVRLRVTPLLGHVSDVVEITPPRPSLEIGPALGDADVGDEPHAGVR